ncbi:Clavaminate synthase-like protein, partial [Saccharata proteae CBS 121410]
FPDIPPFPSDVPTAPLLRISLAKLLQEDADELDRLWQACCDLGFFYIDLRSDGAANGHEGSAGSANVSINGTQLLRDADELFEVQKKFFELPVEEKLKYDFSEKGLYHGYKGYGATNIDIKGNKDRNEFYNISKDDIIGVTPPLPAPSALDPDRPLLRSFINNSHALTILVLSILNDRLSLPPNTLPSLHRLNAVAGDQVRFIRAPPQPPDDRKITLGEHTDFGSVTVLFNRVGGLQVRLPKYVQPILPASHNGADTADQENWAYVVPVAGHAIVNLGDAIVKFTAGLLRSNIHRVVNPPGAQADTTRYSLVYFSRPEDEVVLRTVGGSRLVEEQKERLGLEEGEGEGVTAKVWINRRAMARR